MAEMKKPTALRGVSFLARMQDASWFVIIVIIRAA